MDTRRFPDDSRGCCLSLFSLGRAGLRVQVGDRHTRDYGAACRGPPGLDGRGSVGEFIDVSRRCLLLASRSRERRRG
jgi:hypothetical protein